MSEACLKILLFTPAPEMRGGYLRCFSLGKHLARRGHFVTLACGSSETTNHVTRRIVDGVDLIRLPMQYSVPRIFLADLQRVLINCILPLAHDFDVVHSFVATIPSSAALVFTTKILRSIRALNCSIAVDWEDWWGRGGIWADYGRFYRIPGTFLEERTPFLADIATVVSDILKERALKMGIKREKIYNIPNGANIEFIKPQSKRVARERLGLPRDKVVLSHVGFTDLTAFKVLIEAFEKTADRHADTLLLIVGSLEADHLNVIKTARYSDNIIYAGRVPYTEIPLYLGASDILLLSMRNCIEEHARWPIRLGDYLAAGRPIVATAMAEVTNVIQDCNCGLVARPNDPEGFAEKILDLISRPQWCEELGRSARKAAETKYYWGTIATKLENAYADALHLSR